MPEIDFVVKDLVISQSSAFSMKDLFDFARSWFMLHRYDFYEKEYMNTDKDVNRDMNIKWETEKKVDDYTRFNIEIRFKFFDCHEVQGKKGMMIKGKMSAKFTAYLELDYEDNWSKTMFARFIRALYDKFIYAATHERFRKEIKEETYEIFNEIKSFLKLHTYEA